MISNSPARRSFRRRTSVLSIVAILVLPVSQAYAYETDQLTNRSQAIADSTAVLNRQVNVAIHEVAAEWNLGYDEERFTFKIYRKIGGRNWVDKIERFAMKSPEVERIDAPRWDSIYGDMPIWRTRLTYVFGVSKTIRINDQLIGTDKLGHFISQGRKFYKRYRKHGSEAAAAKRSAWTERNFFGRLGAGSYSNADLVANYEGHRFFRSLFEDDIVAGKPAILRWEAGEWVVQREFDWADHVNEYWDEALNVSHYDPLLYKRMLDRFVSFCPQYWQDPALYAVPNDDVLRARYADLKLRDNRTLRLDSLCPLYAAEIGETTVADAADSQDAAATLQ